jgi:histidine ammonia-lyase
MSTWASRKLAAIVEALRLVLGMEYLAAAQAVEFQRPLRTSEVLERAILALRRHVPRLDEDRVLAPDIERAASLVEDLAELLGEPPPDQGIGVRV